jgi:hypothetical protein
MSENGYLIEDINVFIPDSMDIDTVMGDRGRTCEEMERTIHNAYDKSANIKKAFHEIKKRLQDKDLIWQGIRMGFGSTAIFLCIERDHKIVDKEEVGWVSTV